MQLSEIKEKLENNVCDFDNIIFKISDNDFIPIQYINKISEILNLPVVLCEDINDLKSTSMFCIEPECISLYYIDDINDISISKIKYLYTICSKVSNKDLNDFIVDVPKLEDWHIKNYMQATCPNLNNNNIDLLFNLCNKDIFRINNEINKLSLFNNEQINDVFESFMYDGVLNDLSTYSIFDFVDAFSKKDATKISNIYRELSNIDVNEYGLLVNLISNFRKQIYAVFSIVNNPAYKMSDKQFAFLKNHAYYSKEQLIKILSLLLEMDKKLKAGELDTKYWFDYLMIKIFSI